MEKYWKLLQRKPPTPVVSSNLSVAQVLNIILGLGVFGGASSAGYLYKKQQHYLEKIRNLSAFNPAINETAQELQKLNQQLEQKSQEITKLQAQIEDSKTQKEKMLKQIQKLQAQTKDSETELATQKNFAKQAQKKQAEYLQLSETFKEKEQEFNKLQEEHAQLSINLSEMQDKNLALTNELTNELKKFKKVTDELKDAKDILKKQKLNIEDLTKQIETITQETKELNLTKENLKVSLETLTAENLTQKKHIKTCEEEKKACEEEKKTCDDKIVKFETQKQQIKKKLNELKLLQKQSPDAIKLLSIINDDISRGIIFSSLGDTFNFFKDANGKITPESVAEKIKYIDNAKLEINYIKEVKTQENENLKKDLKELSEFYEDFISRLKVFIESKKVFTGLSIDHLWQNIPEDKRSIYQNFYNNLTPPEYHELLEVVRGQRQIKASLKK